MTLNQEAVTVRQKALNAAIDLHKMIDGLHRARPGKSELDEVTEAEVMVRCTAENFYAWMKGPARIRLHAQQPVYQDSCTCCHTVEQGEDMAQLHTDEKMRVTVDTEDAKGFDVDATLNWGVDDETVVTVEQIDGNDQDVWIVAGGVGSAVVTATVADTDPVLSATLAVDVVPGSVAKISFSEGEVVKQEDDAEPPAEPTT